MPTVLLPPKIDKLLPPSDSGMKAPSKRPKTSFNDAVPDKASPKPKPADDAPPVKKASHGGGGGKKGAAKVATQPTAVVKGKAVDTEETEQTEEESEHPQAKDQQPQPQVNVTDLPVPAKAKTADNAPKTPAQKADKSKADADARSWLKRSILKASSSSNRRILRRTTTKRPKTSLRKQSLSPGCKLPARKSSLNPPRQRRPKLRR